VFAEPAQSAADLPFGDPVEPVDVALVPGHLERQDPGVRRSLPDQAGHERAMPPVLRRGVSGPGHATVAGSMRIGSSDESDSNQSWSATPVSKTATVGRRRREILQSGDGPASAADRLPVTAESRVAP
jgi:hypothetical protein